jgi:hypothetical protein
MGLQKEMISSLIPQHPQQNPTQNLNNFQTNPFVTVSECERGALKLISPCALNVQHQNSTQKLNNFQRDCLSLSLVVKALFVYPLDYIIQFK